MTSHLRPWDIPSTPTQKVGSLSSASFLTMGLSESRVILEISERACRDAENDGRDEIGAVLLESEVCPDVILKTIRRLKLTRAVHQIAPTGVGCYSSENQKKYRPPSSERTLQNLPNNSQRAKQVRDIPYARFLGQYTSLGK